MLLPVTDSAAWSWHCHRRTACAGGVSPVSGRPPVVTGGWKGRDASSYEYIVNRHGVPNQRPCTTPANTTFHRITWW